MGMSGGPSPAMLPSGIEPHVPVAVVVAFLRDEADRYEREVREHRSEHGRDESKSVREKKRAQARALSRAADSFRLRYPVTT